MVWKKKDKKFLDLVMKPPVAVLIWCERGKKWNFFINQLSKQHFPFPIWHGKKKIKRFLPKCTVPFVLIMGKSKKIKKRLRFPSPPTRYIRKGNFFFQAFLENWIKRSDTLDRQRAVEADTPWPYLLPCKRARNVCVHGKGLSPFPAMTCPVW